MDKKTVKVVMIRLEGTKSEVTQVANHIKSKLCVVNESHDIPLRKRDQVHRYLIALPKQGN